MTKINPRMVFTRHYSTFGNKNGDGKWIDILTFYVLPLALGAVVYFFRLGADGISKSVDDSITVLAIFVPPAFALLSQVAALQDRDSVIGNGMLSMLVQHLYANINYVILIALLALAVLLGFEFFSLRYGAGFCAAYAAVALHLFFTLLMVIKRFAVIMDQISPRRQHSA